MTEDDGRAFIDPIDLAKLSAGENVFTVIRGRDYPANGFHPNRSKVGAVLLNSCTVEVR